jgi:uncharacterized protein
MINQTQKNIILNIFQPFEPTMLGVFGSYARSDQNKNSDLDILFDYKKQMNFLDMIGLEQELELKLGIKVDLVSVRSVTESLKKEIENDLISIL